METILITGGSGFLGMHLAKMLSGNNNVWIASRNQKQLLAAAEFSGAQPIPLDCTSRNSVYDVFSHVKPKIVIHAAATKYVDWSEKFPLEAIDINVIGSQNILRASIEFEVSNLVAISTDKASPPIANTYGLTKSLMERSYCLEALKHSNSINISCVRYGNVLWSTGSFLPVWKEMIKSHNHIVTTGSTMTRFFFSVEHAVHLVLTAIQNSSRISGSIITLPMKTASVKEFLDVIIQKTGATFTLADARDGERDQEFLIGSSELDFTEQTAIGSSPYYIITPNKRSTSPLESVISSGNSERLTREEILSFVEPFDALSHV